jgi:hypothetical protein
MRYKEYTLPRFTDFDSTIRELKILRGHNDYEPSCVKDSIETIHKIISKILFKAVLEKEYDIVIKILDYKELSKRSLVDKEGYDLIEFILNNSLNDVFLTLYKKYFDYIKGYFLNIPLFFTIILNKKNFELMEFFLKDDFLKENLKKEHLSNVFFTAVENDKKEFATFILKNFDNVLDIQNIEATLIYFIGNNKLRELEFIFAQNNLIQKLNAESVEKMLGYAVLNKNITILKFMIANPHFAKFIQNGDKNMQKCVLNLMSNNLLN